MKAFHHQTLCTRPLQVSILSIVIVAIWKLQDKVHSSAGHVVPADPMALQSAHPNGCRTVQVFLQMAGLCLQGIKIVKNIPKGLPGFTADEWFPIDGPTSKASPPSGFCLHQNCNFTCQLPFAMPCCLLATLP
jgi:hypothetical protein